MIPQRPAPSVATVHRNATAIAEQNGWTRPSYVTVRNIIEGLEEPLVMLAQEGTKAY